MNPAPALPALLLAAGLATGLVAAVPAPASPAAPGASALQAIDLPTTLRLAGAQNLDVQLAAQRLAEARANDALAREQYFPWLTVGGGYAHHEGRAQAVDGGLIDASKQSYVADGALNAQLSLGEVYYRALAARQDREAAAHAFAAQRLQTTLAAAAGYLELSRAEAAVGVAAESLEITRDYTHQLHQAVEAGLAFLGDLRRLEVETLRRQSELRRRQETRRLDGSRLAVLLHLDATVDLTPADAIPPRLLLVATNRALDGLVAEALNARPELKAGEAGAAAARELRNQTVYGPLVPTLGLAAAAGGMGGGINGSWNHFGATQDYLVGLGWRIGPGGLLDRPRQDASDARLASAKTRLAQIHDEIVAQVVTAQVRRQSQADQAAFAAAGVKAAESALDLTRSRKEFGVAAVLEFLQAEQALTASRDELVTALAGAGEAEYALAAAVGALATPPAEPSQPRKK